MRQFCIEKKIQIWINIEFQVIPQIEIHYYNGFSLFIKKMHGDI